MARMLFHPLPWADAQGYKQKAPLGLIPKEPAAIDMQEELDHDIIVYHLKFLCGGPMVVAIKTSGAFGERMLTRSS